MTWRERMLWAAWVGFTCSAGFGVKMTALATPGIIAVESFFAIWFLKRSIPLPDLLMVLASAFATFCVWFACHLALMINWHVQASTLLGCVEVELALLNGEALLRPVSFFSLPLCPVYSLPSP